jgi:hypothetical protein
MKTNKVGPPAAGQSIPGDNSLKFCTSAADDKRSAEPSCSSTRHVCQCVVNDAFRLAVSYTVTPSQHDLLVFLRFTLDCWKALRLVHFDVESEMISSPPAAHPGSCRKRWTTVNTCHHWNQPNHQAAEKDPSCLIIQWLLPALVMFWLWLGFQNVKPEQKPTSGSARLWPESVFFLAMFEVGISGFGLTKSQARPKQS